MSEKKYMFDECKKNISGICSRCGGNLVPLETVDNSGNPAFWPGCVFCSIFNYGTTPEIYAIAKEMVEDKYFRPYSHICFKSGDSEETVMSKKMDQIQGACEVVADILYLYKKNREGESG